MKIVIHTSLALVVAAAGAVAIGACEGEPPKYPVVAPGAANGGGVEQVDAAGLGEPAPSAAPTATAAPTSMTPCMPAAGDAGTGGTATATAAASAAPTDAPAAAAAVPEPAKTANIVGTVTTTPANNARNAVVWLEDAPKEGTPPKHGNLVIDNKQMTFAPYVGVVAAGSKVTFLNSDPFPHNVFSPDNDRFNMGAIAQGNARAKTFTSPGTYSLLCNLHPGMLGYLVVAPNAWFARTDAGGKFTVANVPAGTYRLTAWAPRQVSATQTVTIAGSDATVTFDLHRK